ncbi:MAG TPA: prepilin-type N-terminal cleavage/methylation domain-containing protein [Dissulfurispiraceae bacterium]|nr:prepilin-type N-terminal cleavage/methylation domain-containing protein [Dissulfurispiraceae bacterium]
MKQIPAAPKDGFTLLEILVALALLGIALLVIVQLFSADLRGIAVSDDYVVAVARAESMMRELLDDDKLSEMEWSESADDGYRIHASVKESLKDRTENLQVRLLDIGLTVDWTKGGRDRSVTLSTQKVMNKEVGL